MVLYTVVDLNDVMRQEPLPEKKVLRRGISLLECRAGENGPVVERLISTDPADYLRRDLSPGQPLRK